MRLEEESERARMSAWLKYQVQREARPRKEAEAAELKAALSDAVNALGVKVAGHQDKTRHQHAELTASIKAMRDGLGERIGSLEHGQSEIKDLLVRVLNKP
jgi:hypothetical protein